jgi:hypothetical protein
MKLIIKFIRYLVMLAYITFSLFLFIIMLMLGYGMINEVLKGIL